MQKLIVGKDTLQQKKDANASFFVIDRLPRFVSLYECGRLHSYFLLALLLYHLPLAFDLLVKKESACFLAYLKPPFIFVIVQRA